MTEEREPVKHRVAVKIIKLGMDTKQVVARFEAERQALALMDHPIIAKVLDGDSTETGRPSFVMELVRGIPVTQFLYEHQLRTDARLEWFVQNCQALQHAHQKGIVHRDIKPTDILLIVHDDDRPVPKVIDFGIAKTTQMELTEKTLFTQFRQFIGTPACMSPEQAPWSDVDIDTRNDVYSLGVLLYELLTGRTPLEGRELMNAGYDEICRRIREQEPSLPSTRLSMMADAERGTIAKERREDPRKLGMLFRGDLDWIVMKALEKDRTRCYGTANDFARDIQRFIEVIFFEGAHFEDLANGVNFAVARSRKVASAMRQRIINQKEGQTLCAGGLAHGFDNADLPGEGVEARDQSVAGTDVN